MLPRSTESSARPRRSAFVSNSSGRASPTALRAIRMAAAAGLRAYARLLKESTEDVHWARAFAALGMAPALAPNCHGPFRNLAPLQSQT
eukprot:8577325-Pyramimonas_sp.AAC.1